MFPVWIASSASESLIVTRCNLAIVGNSLHSSLDAMEGSVFRGLDSWPIYLILIAPRFHGDPSIKAYSMTLQVSFVSGGLPSGHLVVLVNLVGQKHTGGDLSVLIESLVPTIVLGQ